MSVKPSRRKIKLDPTDVIVVGAGLAGLQAAVQVQRAGKTVRIVKHGTG